MNFISQLLSVVFGIALLGLLGVGIYYAFNFVTENLFASLDPQLSAITAIAAATLLISSCIIASALRGSQRDIHVLNIKKRLAYEQFIQIWRKVFWQNSQQQTGIDASDLQELEKQFILWANPKIIQAYIKLRQLAAETHFSDPKVRAQFIKVLMEIRKDLGLSNLGLNEQELLKWSEDFRDHLAGR
ncbi:hypothetical protein Nit79A3_1026 [Nitrosomonas sp. Is79A3]|uniref:hypothetical protein n=1 Tax=Nitrosomonas sp. (strain Is79A3) TaxID=261292 RepID=UPI000215C753